MALHPDFPADPYAPLLPDQRWFPAAEELRASAYEKLLPPLVAKIREEVKTWRDAGYAGASETSRSYGCVHVDQEGFEKHAPRDFADIVAAFREFQPAS
ncbi:MAG: hypothetical protein Q8O34_14030 [Rhodocyclaceae bacterium]|nr:hypothetical protein [Rhodocyclaceae bacterium]